MKHIAGGLLGLGVFGLLVSVVACGSGSEHEGAALSSEQALTSVQARVLGFETPAADWSSPGKTIGQSTTHTEGTTALSVVASGWTEIASRTLDSLGSDVLANASFDLRLPATLPWGEARLVVRIPSKGIFWQDLGGKPLGGLAAGTFHKLTFAVPSDLVTTLKSTYSDLDFRIVLNVPFGSSAYLVDNLVVAGAGGGGGGTPVSTSFSITVPQGVSLPNAFISATNRLQVDDRVTLGTTSELENISNFGAGGLELGSTGHAHANVYNAAGPAMLRSRAHVRGFVRTHAPTLGTQEPVFVDGGRFTNTPTTPVTTSWTVTWPATNAGPITVPTDTTLPPLAPGAYGDLQAYSRSKVYLRSGTYYFESFKTEPEAEVFLDKTQGPIFLYVRNEFRYHGRFIENGGPAGQLLVGYLGTLPADLQVGFTGTIVAPNAKVDVKRPTVGEHQGAFFGKDIEVYSDGTVLHVPFDFGFLCPLGDTDSDGTFDCSDLCKRDPLKTDPLICGCGIEETDTDLDGAPNCVDECPNDPTKQIAGDCGCSDDPAPAGTSCDDAVCRGNFTCDGAGHCGSCTPPAPGCVAKAYNSKYYWFCPGPVSWEQAKAVCGSIQTPLVEIETSGENLFVAKNLVGGSAWTGANDRTTEGQWRWSKITSDAGNRFWDGGPSGKRYFARFSSWAGGAPAESGPDCATIASTGLWSNGECASSAGFVCEVPTARPGDIGEPPPGGNGGCDELGTCDDRGPIDETDCVDDSVFFGDLDQECPEGSSCPLLDAFAFCEAECAEHGEGSTECNDACTGPAALPTPGSRCDFSPMELGYCTLKTATIPLQPCVEDSQCTGAGEVCGRFYDCPVEDRDGTTGVCFATGEVGDPRGGTVCGIPVDGCPTNDDPDDCGEVDLCDPVEEQTVDDPLDTGSNLTPEPFDPEEEFGEPESPSTTDPYPDDSDPCGGTCPVTQDHPWCTLVPPDDLGEREPQQPNKAGNSEGDLVSFAFEPKLSLSRTLDVGPFGIPDLNVRAEAGFKADVTYGIAGGGTIPILDILAALDADECGVVGDTTLSVFGENFLPVLQEIAETDVEFPFEAPSAEARQACEDAFTTLRNTANRAKKAYRDALELLKQYEALKNTASDTDNLSRELCEQLVAQRPRGFPAGSCPEDPEDTINRFIDYYERTVLGFNGVDGAKGLVEAAADLANNQYGIQPAPFQLFGFDESEEVVVAQVQFFIGPIPCNLEILTTMGYGASIDASLHFQPGTIIEQMLSTNQDNAAQPVASVQVGGSPFAYVGLAAFAGVGFSVPGFTAKLGIESRLNLGRIWVPAHAGTGIGLGAEIDGREPPAEVAPFTTGVNLIPPKRIVADLNYTAYLGVKLRDILSGDIAGKLKIKVLFFSKSWRKTLLKFNGFCPLDSNPLHVDNGSPCDFTLVSADGSVDAASGTFPWGAVRPFMPFPKLAKLTTKVTPGTGEIDKSKVADFFYDSLCQCIDGDDPYEARECFRNDDCCDNTPVCMPGPGGTNICTDCREENEFCNVHTDCCSGSCVDNKCVPCLNQTHDVVCSDDAQCCGGLSCFTPLDPQPGVDPSCTCVGNLSPNNRCRSDSECCSGNCRCVGLGTCGPTDTDANGFCEEIVQ